MKIIRIKKRTLASLVNLKMQDNGLNKLKKPRGIDGFI